eukprot:TRINITY_DN105708_c0_g1_i1.p1 TRINITY_DN105708_c0_g1~~TRINITY_DN105708_c0_g1_i1.p1  ORF type:complete len:397 (+),score=58.68 TRINITY_DN105708_c0_g1_i1:163-1191(+)
MMFPTQHALSSFWVPTHERATLITFMTSGQDLGSVLATIISPRLLENGTWCVFAGWGLLALLWFVAYCVYCSSAPELHKKCIDSGEAGWIMRHRQTKHFDEVRLVQESPCPRRLLAQPCIWAIFAGHVGVNYSWYVILSWMPSFFTSMHNLDLTKNAQLVCLPYVASWFGTVLGGRISDYLVMKGVRTRIVRKTMQLSGAIGSALFLQLAASAETAYQAAFWISLGTFAAKLQNSGYWVNMVDVCPEAAGTVMGISNTIATIPGIVGQPITQMILQTSGGDHSVLAWHIVFGIGGAVGVSAALIFAAFADDVPIEVTGDRVRPRSIEAGARPDPIGQLRNAA